MVALIAAAAEEIAALGFESDLPLGEGELWHLVRRWAGRAERVGFVHLRDEPEGIELWQITVAPEHRGRGLGGAALAALQARGRPIRLAVRRESPAVRLYRRCGFRLTDEGETELYMIWTPRELR